MYNTIGGVSLSLGILGAFLPLLPSTYFALLAAWAFAKSSPAFHTWLYQKSPFAKSIQNWQQHRVIPNKVKWIAAASMTTSFLITAMVVENVYIVSGIGVGMLALLIFLFSKPSNPASKVENQIIYSPLSEFRQPVI